MPHRLCTSRTWIWWDDMGISCFSFIPLGIIITTKTNFFNQKYGIFPCCADLLRAVLGYISFYTWNRPCHCDSSSLMWLSTTWCDFLKSPLCHRDDVTFPRLMWLGYGARKWPHYIAAPWLISPNALLPHDHSISINVSFYTANTLITYRCETVNIRNRIIISSMH